MNVSNMSTLFHLMEEDADTLMNLNPNDYTVAVEMEGKEWQHCTRNVRLFGGRNKRGFSCGFAGCVWEFSKYLYKNRNK